MTVVVSPPRLASMRAEGVENNPVVGVGDIFQLSGALAGDGDVARAVDGATYTYWTTAAAAPTIAKTLSPARVVSMAGVAAHNLATVGATIRPQYLVGATWTDLAAAVTPSDGATIIWLFSATSAEQFRFSITGNTGETAVGVVFMGETYTFDQRFYAGYDEARYPSEVTLLTNETGPHLLGSSIVSRGSFVEWSFEHLAEASVYNDDFAAFVSDFNAGKGFFAAWRPQDYGAAYYAWRAGDPVRVVNSGPKKRKSLGLRMRVYDDV